MVFSVETESQIGLAVGQGVDVAAYPADWQERQQVPDFLYRPRTLLVRDRDLTALLALLDELSLGTVEPQRVVEGVARVQWRDDTTSFADVLERVAAQDPPLAATPEHLLYVSGHCCAATEQLPVPDWQGPMPRAQIGEGATHPLCGHGLGATVRIYDTGLVVGAAETHPWMTGVVAVDGEFEDPYQPDGTLFQDGGHGTFVAGCLRCAAPEAAVEVVRLDVGPAHGGVFEGELAARLAADIQTWLAAPATAPDVVVIGYAGTTFEQEPLLAFEALHNAFDALGQARAELGKLLIVAPAGNDGDVVPNYPASFPWVVSVGATATNWRDRAWFSNHCDTVDVYAPGEGIVNAYPLGDYTRKWAWDATTGGPQPPDQLGDTRSFVNGMALWSGTSFSAPLVAGLVASRMSSAGETSVEAWSWLRAVARSQAVPGTGPVLLPGQGCCSAC